MAMTTGQALTRYHEFRSGWSWDLAYYNQWFWSITRGDGLLSVRPVSAYALEGPSVWTMNYLAPIRFALIPIYSLWPDPRVLLTIQNVTFWLIIPAAFSLVRSEAGSECVGLSAALLVPLTPLVWPLVWNDFRELQLALPFVLWGIQGWRERNPRLASLGIAGMLACRQEYALVVASMSLLPARDPETPAARANWTAAALVVGFGWFLVAFLGYQWWRLGSHAPAAYLSQFAAPGTSTEHPVRDMIELVVVGFGSWTAFALFAPRIALLAVPWVWGLSSGRLTLQSLGTIDWHHVRYAAPATALVLAAGLVGFARLPSLLPRRVQTKPLLASLWTLSAVMLLAGSMTLTDRLGEVPRLISQVEADQLWFWIAQVKPNDAVLAAYEVTAPLSSRRWLFSYRLDENKPPGYPRLSQDIAWAFIRPEEMRTKILRDQGFEEVGAGPIIHVYRRRAASAQ